MKPLEVKGLLKAYQNVVAVDHVDFHVNQGEIVGLVGPNGAGKTTLIKSIIGIELPDRGKVRIFGEDPYTKPERAKWNISYVPEKPELLHDCTIQQHVEFMAAAYYAEDFQEEMRELFREFDILEKRHVHQRELSKGQTQKALIVAAFIHHPTLMFFDEPLLGIDPKGGAKLKDLIRKKKEDGGSVIISSHMLDLIEELSDRIVIIDNGKIIADGSLEELKQQAALGSDTTISEVFLKITEDIDLEEDEG